MKILFLPNWEVPVLDQDTDLIQSPDKYVKNKMYWFFQYFPSGTEVDVIDFQKNNLLHWIERKVLKTYVWQSILAFRKRKQYDIVISHGAQSGIVYSFLRNFSSNKSPDHYIIDVGGMNGSRNNRLEVSILKLALKSNPYIICHSRVIIENYKKTFPNLIPRSAFVPFGVDTDYFFPVNTLPPKEKYILSFGERKRDYDTLFKAWEKLGYTDVKLRIIGKEARPEEQIPSNVELMKKVRIQTLIEQINDALFVVIPLPLYNYSYGQMSFLQSMSIGKTVIVTKTPSSVDYITENQGAFFVKPYDVEDMKEKVQFLLENPEALKESDEKARPYVLQHFSEKQMGEGMADFISLNSRK